MKISYKWLKEYVDTDWSVDELANCLTLVGAEVEDIESVGGDHCLHIEVTSNRPDWNGHVGIAREIASCLSFNNVVKRRLTSLSSLPRSFFSCTSKSFMPAINPASPPLRPR